MLVSWTLKNPVNPVESRDSNPIISLPCTLNAPHSTTQKVTVITESCDSLQLAVARIGRWTILTDQYHMDGRSTSSPTVKSLCQHKTAAKRKEVRVLVTSLPHTVTFVYAKASFCCQQLHLRRRSCTSRRRMSGQCMKLKGSH